MPKCIPKDEFGSSFCTFRNSASAQIPLKNLEENVFKTNVVFCRVQTNSHFTFLMMHKLFLSDSFLRKSVLLRLVDVLQFSTFQSGISATKN